MADFVTDDACQLGLAVEIGHDAPRDIDVTARQGEGIDLRRIQHRECPGEIGAVRLLGQALADVVHIGLQARVVDHAVFLQGALVGLAAFGDFILFVHHRSLGAAGDGVDDGGAAARGKDCCRQQGQQPPGA
jgi:hypothetical protein